MKPLGSSRVRFAGLLIPLLLVSCGQFYIEDFIPFTRREVDVFAPYLEPTVAAEASPLRLAGVASARGGIPAPGRPLTWVTTETMDLEVRLANRATTSLSELAAALLRPGSELIPEGKPLPIGRLGPGQVRNLTLQWPGVRRPGPLGFVLACRYRQAGRWKVVHLRLQVHRPGVWATSLRDERASTTRPMTLPVEGAVLAPSLGRALGYSLVASPGSEVRFDLRLVGRKRGYVLSSYFDLTGDPAVEAAIEKTWWGPGPSRNLRIRLRVKPGTRPGVFPLSLAVYFLAGFDVRVQPLRIDVGVYSLEKEQGAYVLRLPASGTVRLEGTSSVRLGADPDPVRTFRNVARAASEGLAAALRGGRVLYSFARGTAPERRRGLLHLAACLLGRVAGLDAVEGAARRSWFGSGSGAAFGEALLVEAERRGHDEGAALLHAAVRRIEPAPSGRVGLAAMRARKVAPGEPVKGLERPLPLRLVAVQAGGKRAVAPRYRADVLPLDLTYDVSRLRALVANQSAAVALNLVLLAEGGHRVRVRRNWTSGDRLTVRIDRLPPGTYRLAATLTAGRRTLGVSKDATIVYSGPETQERRRTDLLGALSLDEMGSLNRDERFEKIVEVRRRRGLEVRDTSLMVLHQSLLQRGGPLASELVSVKWDENSGLTTLTRRVRSQRPRTWKFLVGSRRVRARRRQRLLSQREPAPITAGHFAAGRPRLVSFDIRGRFGKDLDLLSERVSGSPLGAASNLVVIETSRSGLLRPGWAGVESSPASLEEALVSLAVNRLAAISGNGTPTSVRVALKTLELARGVRLVVDPGVLLPRRTDRQDMAIFSGRPLARAPVQETPAYCMKVELPAPGHDDPLAYEPLAADVVLTGARSGEIFDQAMSDVPPAARTPMKVFLSWLIERFGPRPKPSKRSFYQALKYVRRLFLEFAPLAGLSKEPEAYVRALAESYTYASFWGLMDRRLRKVKGGSDWRQELFWYSRPTRPRKPVRPAVIPGRPRTPPIFDPRPPAGPEKPIFEPLFPELPGTKQGSAASSAARSGGR